MIIPFFRMEKVIKLAYLPMRIFTYTVMFIFKCICGSGRDPYIRWAIVFSTFVSVLFIKVCAWLLSDLLLLPRISATTDRSEFYHHQDLVLAMGLNPVSFFSSHWFSDKLGTYFGIFIWSCWPLLLVFHILLNLLHNCRFCLKF